MEQRLNLERTLRDEREKLNAMRADVRELEHRVNQKMLVRLGPLNMRQGDVVRQLLCVEQLADLISIILSQFQFKSCSFQMKNTDGLEREIGVLRNTCDMMADEVTKITKGAGEQIESIIVTHSSH